MLADSGRWAVFAAVGPAGRWLGFVEVSLREDDQSVDRKAIGFLEGWYVVEDHRAKGIGRVLVGAAEAWARAQGCKAMGSDTQLNNLGSQGAHQALGYQEVSRTVLFRKELP